jgi:hypothetical protein
MSRIDVAHWEQPSQQMAKFRAMFTELYSLLHPGAGAPVNAAKATRNLNPAGNDNGLTFTAVDFGAAGNDISIAYVDPAGNNAALSVTVASKAITVHLATGAGGAITSTAAAVLAAINASAAAAALVTVAIMTADAGVADDGSGVVTALAALNLAGGLDGTGAGEALPGSLYIDTVGARPYRNSGTTAAPAWTALDDAD